MPEQLRRLQDIQVTVEGRFLTLSDPFFERVGIDFDFDVEDDASIAPSPNFGGADDVGGSNSSGPSITIGLTDAGLPTEDLDLRIKQNSFGASTLVFREFTTSGAATFRFAILSDIEVFLLMQATKDDQRTNVLQAPK